jgi:hypothetical protein
MGHTGAALLGSYHYRLVVPSVPIVILAFYGVHEPDGCVTAARARDC